MTDYPVVYVGEAYKDGERIEQLVHATEAGAWEDIEVSTDLYDPDRVQVVEKRLYGGKAGTPSIELGP